MTKNDDIYAYMGGWRAAHLIERFGEKKYPPETYNRSERLWWLKGFNEHRHCACGNVFVTWKFNGGNPWIVCEGCQIKIRDVR